MKRILITLAVALSSVLPAQAQYTTAPYTLQQYFGNTGLVLDAGGMCVYLAGTSTLATTYATASGTANANPLLFNAAGRPSSGGFFLVPGTSYKFVLKDFTGVVSPTCVPDTGVTIWSQDNIRAVPISSGAVDVTGTAGETVTAGQVVYLSAGDGGKNQGQWYLADADLDYASVIPMIGIATADATTGGTISVRTEGLIEGLSGLSVGADYYVSATAGGLSSSIPALGRLVGRSQSATTLVVAPNPALLPTIRPTVVTLTDAASVSLNAAIGNVFSLTAAGNRTILAPSNPVAGQKIIIRVFASGGARTITLTTGSSGAFRFGTDVTGLTATSSGTTDYIGCVYNAVDSRWDVVAYAKGY